MAGLIFLFIFKMQAADTVITQISLVFSNILRRAGFFETFCLYGHKHFNFQNCDEWSQDLP